MPDEFHLLIKGGALEKVHIKNIWSAEEGGADIQNLMRHGSSLRNNRSGRGIEYISIKKRRWKGEFNGILLKFSI